MVIVRDVRAAIARAAAIVYGDPTRALDVVGITGTNGKTTTSYLVCRALESSGRRPGLIGTVDYRFEDLVLEAPHTTPEADEIARIAADDAGPRSVAPGDGGLVARARTGRASRRCTFARLRSPT